VFSQVAFEAAPGEETGIIAVRGDEHERARLAVRRAGCVNEHAHRQGIASRALAIEQRKERT